MAANYWESSQRKYWTFTKKELADMRKALENEHQQLVTQFPLPDRRVLNVYFGYRKSPIYPYNPLVLMSDRR